MAPCARGRWLEQAVSMQTFMVRDGAARLLTMRSRGVGRPDGPRPQATLILRRRVSAVSKDGPQDPPAGSNLQPFLADGGVCAEVGGRALEHDAAVAHHVEPRG